MQRVLDFKADRLEAQQVSNGGESLKSGELERIMQVIKNIENDTVDHLHKIDQIIYKQK